MTTPGARKERPSLNDLENSLAEIEQLYLDCRTMPWCLNGNTLKYLKVDGALDGEKLEFAVPETWMNYPEGSMERRHMLRELNKKQDFKWQGNMITFTSRVGIPIEVTLIPRGNEYFEHIDTAFFYNNVFPVYIGKDVIPIDFQFSVPARWKAWLSVSKDNVQNLFPTMRGDEKEKKQI